MHAGVARAEDALEGVSGLTDACLEAPMDELHLAGRHVGLERTSELHPTA
jgi:hypothetical protein